MLAFLNMAMQAGGCDLHLHTNHSDGSDPPERLIDRALSHGLRCLAITDHDRVSALPVARAYLATLGDSGYQPRPCLICGVELSVDYLDQECHLLGYFPHEHLASVASFLDEQARLRAERNDRLIGHLQNLGYAITAAEFAATGQGSIGRLQVAKLLCQHGYFVSIDAAFEQLLGEGKPGYVERLRPSAAAAMQIIHNAGGAAVLAHPALYGWCAGDAIVSPVLLQRLTDLLAQGLDGVEAYHGQATRAEQIEIAAAGHALGLLCTAGSDDHGENKSWELIYSGSDRWPDRKEILVVAALISGRRRQNQPTYLLGRRRPSDHQAGYWELPGGKVEAGETPQAALIRELAEELAIQAEPGRLHTVLTYEYPEARVILVVLNAKIKRGAPMRRVHDRLRYLTAGAALQENLLPADVTLFRQLADKI
jgi:hypothetical protein